MGREIARKNIDEELVPSGAQFDEKVLEKIEEEFDQISPMGGQSLFEGPSGGNGNSKAASDKDFSLDDLEGFSHESLSRSFKEETPAPAALETEGAAVDQEEDPGEQRRRVPKRKILWLGAAAFLLLGMVGFACALWWPTSNGSAPVRLVRKPVPIPRFPGKVQLLLPLKVGKKADILSLELELEFLGERSFEQFEQSPTMLRDRIYRYLLHEHPELLSYTHWQETVEKKLFSHLKESLPATGIGAVRLLQMDVL
ncbi:MAG TPA: hypothetical protein PLM79_03970 [Syntrophobacteraceae bacterium]|nr:hypothetical protein [Syntrophobacteraceae bacterium]